MLISRGGGLHITLYFLFDHVTLTFNLLNLKEMDN